MALLEIEQAAAHRDTMNYEAAMTAVVGEIGVIQGQIQQSTDPVVIMELIRQIGELYKQVGELTQDLAAMRAHEANIARWIATMAQPAPGVRALADIASELLALFNAREHQLRESQDKFRAIDESHWMHSVQMSDLARRLQELTDSEPNLVAAKKAMDDANVHLAAYIAELTT